MKNNRVKLSALILSSGLLLGVASSCQKDFERINTDHRQAPESSLQLDGLKSGAYFSSFLQKIFPVGSSGTGYVNDFQIPYTLGGANWMGYFAPTKNKWVGRGFPTYALKPWSNYTSSVMGGRTLQDWPQLRESTKDDPAAFAVATIAKVATVHKLTDTFGPIAYPLEGEAGDGVLLSGFRAQDVVYYAMLGELQRAVETLDTERHNVLPKYDLVYEGDYQKWQKLANSIMLRMANRIVYAAPDSARKYAELAITNPSGVIEQRGDIAGLSAGAGIALKNPMTIIAGAYNDIRLGAELYSYLKGYEDPRLGRFFSQGTQTINGVSVSDYYAVRTNLPETGLYEKGEEFASLNVSDNTPVYIMRPSEVYFLRAEGAMRGWNMGGGSAESYYNAGITSSFEENGLSASDASSYLQNASRVPARFVDSKNTAYNHDAASTITIRWDESASEETKLERIITQKYLALFPDGQEAWSEYRRTGYPRIFTPVHIATDSEVVPSRTGTPTRIPYSPTEYSENLENITQAVRLLGGADNGATRVWWDKKNRN